MIYLFAVAIGAIAIGVAYLIGRSRGMKAGIETRRLHIVVARCAGSNAYGAGVLRNDGRACLAVPGSIPEEAALVCMKKLFQCGGCDTLVELLPDELSPEQTTQTRRKPWFLAPRDPRSRFSPMDHIADFSHWGSFHVAPENLALVVDAKVCGDYLADRSDPRCIALRQYLFTQDLVRRIEDGEIEDVASILERVRCQQHEIRGALESAGIRLPVAASR